MTGPGDCCSPIFIPHFMVYNSDYGATPALSFLCEMNFLKLAKTLILHWKPKESS